MAPKSKPKTWSFDAATGTNASSSTILPYMAVAQAASRAASVERAAAFDSTILSVMATAQAASPATPPGSLRSERLTPLSEAAASPLHDEADEAQAAATPLPAVAVQAAATPLPVAAQIETAVLGRPGDPSGGGHGAGTPGHPATSEAATPLPAEEHSEDDASEEDDPEDGVAPDEQIRAEIRADQETELAHWSSVREVGVAQAAATPLLDVADVAAQIETAVLGRPGDPSGGGDGAGTPGHPATSEDYNIHHVPNDPTTFTSHGTVSDEDLGNFPVLQTFIVRQTNLAVQTSQNSTDRLRLITLSIEEESWRKMDPLIERTFQYVLGDHRPIKEVAKDVTRKLLIDVKNDPVGQPEKAFGSGFVTCMIGDILRVTPVRRGVLDSLAEAALEEQPNGAGPLLSIPLLSMTEADMKKSSQPAHITLIARKGAEDCILYFITGIRIVAIPHDPDYEKTSTTMPPMFTEAFTKDYLYAIVWSVGGLLLIVRGHHCTILFMHCLYMYNIYSIYNI